MHRMVSIQKFIAAICCVAVLFFLSSTSAVRAAITPVGNVLPADNPLTDLVNEGLPPNGNFPDSSEPVGAQTHYEAKNPLVAPAITPTVIGIPDANVVVGQTSFGRLDIDGLSQLRYQTLVIGDSGVVGSQTRFGNGRVTITGLDALYNNDPNINFPGLPANFSSTGAYKRLTNVGFDLYVGRAGTGVLDIHGGGRAEIQDAVVVGDLAGSNGTILVDGINSYLGSGNFVAPTGPADTDPHAMFIGRRGIGNMTISNGGQVLAESQGVGSPGLPVIGAVVGGDPFQPGVEPETGGVGTVTVDGLGSTWTVRNSLQLGGFDDPQMLGPNIESQGDDTDYNSTVGRGTLNVNNGAIVSILPPENNVLEADIDLAIGRFGRLNLNGGYISIGNPGTRLDNIRLVNDGVISGSGRIDTGVFRNRYLGEIRVSAGQHLIIDSSSQFETATDDEPMFNFGVIEAVGTSDARAEFEIDRAPNAEDNPIRPFLNLPLTTTPAFGRTGGQITAQWSNLRFRSGIQNSGTMAFTGGSNMITGRVDNISSTKNGRFLVFPDTTVVAEDDFTVGGRTGAASVDAPILTMREGSKLIVADQGSFSLTGHLDMELSFDSPAKIEVAGDVGLDGDLYVSFDNGTLGSLSHGNSFELIYFAGFIGGVDSTDPVQLKPDLTTNPVLNVVPDPFFQVLYPNLDLIAARVLQSYYLFVLDPTMVGPPGGPGAMGADFNGDGIVNGQDLAIWRLNVGITTGASVLQGDADGDGDVDGDDFFYWQQHVGLPSGSGSFINGIGAVPEPTAGLLLALGGLLALATRRRGQW